MTRLLRWLSLAGGWLVLAVVLVAALLDHEPVRRQEGPPWNRP